MIRDRRGFTLIELLVVAVLGTLVLGAVLQVLITNQRTYTAQTAVVQGQQNSRMAFEMLFNELREASPGDGDIVSMSSTQITVRLMRKFGVVCATDLASLTPNVTVLDNTGDDFAAADSVVLFAENREATPNDDVWLRLEVDAADTTVTCLGRPGIEVGFDVTTLPMFVADSVRVGAPLRSFREYTFGTVNWNGKPYLGRSEDGGLMWPIAGPLRAANGMQFIYRDALGNVTATPTDVRQIEIRVRTGSEVTNSVGRMVSDSIDAWIYTRN
jgi:prepilin-type N-terminal cleavage/methylation domain-containing protein